MDKAPDSTPQDFIKAAAEYGLELTEADFQPAASKGDLADDELEAVTGGGSMADANLCFCAIGGGGEGLDIILRSTFWIFIQLLHFRLQLLVFFHFF